ncbi:MAG: hypothetical protein ACYTAN_00295 [Planctomycetota bacterium]|jgi:hypothetical protein
MSSTLHDTDRKRITGTRWWVRYAKWLLLVSVCILAVGVLLKVRSISQACAVYGVSGGQLLAIARMGWGPMDIEHVYHGYEMVILRWMGDIVVLLAGVVLLTITYLADMRTKSLTLRLWDRLEQLDGATNGPPRVAER